MDYYGKVVPYFGFSFGFNTQPIFFIYYIMENFEKVFQLFVYLERRISGGLYSRDRSASHDLLLL